MSMLWLYLIATYFNACCMPLTPFCNMGTEGFGWQNGLERWPVMKGARFEI